MAWKRWIPGYLITLLFCAAACFCTFLYASNHFITLGQMSFVYAIVYTVLSVLAAALITLLLGGVVAKKLQERALPPRLYLIVCICVFAAGGAFLFYRALTAEVTTNALYVMMATDYLEMPSNVTTSTKLYLTILSNLITMVSVTPGHIVLIQAILFLVAAVLVFFGVRLIGGKIAAVMTLAAMLFLPVFPGITDEVSDAVIFYLLLGAGLTVGGLFCYYVPDPQREYPLMLKGLIALFSGVFTGVITGWDGGLIILALLSVYVLFADLKCALRVIPFTLLYLAAFAAGFVLCAQDPAAWFAAYLAPVRLLAPLPHTTYTLVVMIVSTLSLFAPATFLVKRTHERVTFWMIAACMTMFFAAQITQSATSTSSFLVLMLIILFGTALSDLFTPYSAEKVAEEAAEEVSARREMKEELKKAKKEAALKKKEEAARKKEQKLAARAAEKAKKPDETPSPKEVVALVREEIAVAEKEAVPAQVTQTKQLEEAAPAAETKPQEEAAPVTETKPQEEEEELHVPDGMVLPLGDEEADADTEVHIRFDDLPGTYSIGINRGEEKTVAEESVTEEPAAVEPAAEEPVTEEPVTEEHVEEEPATEEPVTEEPATEEPATEEPVTEEPAVEEEKAAVDLSDFDLPMIEGDDFDL
ncbi:MAG: hypothetical protein IJQ12_09445 [Lachnospiraceae bacterium]|nr:hypothetical protein [Lachnospiraceae bacterium]